MTLAQVAPTSTPPVGTGSTLANDEAGVDERTGVRAGAPPPAPVCCASNSASDGPELSHSFPGRGRSSSSSSKESAGGGATTGAEPTRSTGGAVEEGGVATVAVLLSGG